MDFILDFHEMEIGVFYSSLTDRQPDTLQDMMASCMSGLVAIYTGEIGIARGVGRWLGTVRDASRISLVCCIPFTPGRIH